MTRTVARTLRVTAGATLLVGTLAAFAEAVRLAAAYVTPALGPLGWGMIVLLGGCGALAVAPLLAAGATLIRPELAERWRFAHALPFDEWSPGREDSGPASEEPGPRPGRRHGLDPFPLVLAAVTATIAVILGYLAFPGLT